MDDLGKMDSMNTDNELPTVQSGIQKELLKKWLVGIVLGFVVIDVVIYLVFTKV